MSDFQAKNASNPISSQAPPQTPLGELTGGGGGVYSVPPDPIAAYKRAYF